MDTCLFCRIIVGEIPCTKVYEDDHVFAFLDINPINKGHTLVIPKRHLINLYDMPNEVCSQCIFACKKIAVALKKAVKADGINIGMNNDPASGQAVFHAHLHVIPRFSGDGLHHWPGKKYQPGEDAQVAKQISSQLN